jgi:hypothetical protein
MRAARVAHSRRRQRALSLYCRQPANNATVPFMSSLELFTA